MKIVAIGDCHATPGYDNKRFEAMGEFAAEELSGVDDAYIVQIGDWSDCVAFNEHGTKLEMETVRWEEDKEVTLDSLDRFMDPFYRRKKKLPTRTIILGNHENRVTRWIEQNPRFQGAFNVNQLGFERFGFQVVPYMRTMLLGGIHFVHHLGSSNGTAAKISSPTNGIKSVGVTTVVGHTHTAGWFPVNYKDRKIHGLDLGCAIHKDMGYQENWSCPTAHKYDRCIWVFDNVKNGDFDFRMVRLESLGV